MSRVEFFTTGTTFEFIVLGMDIAQSERSLEVPVLRKIPLFSGSDAASGIPTFIAMVAQSFQQSERKLHASHIILAAQGMGTQEPSLEVLAEPVAILWHHQPVTKSRLVSATLLPRIQAQENLSRLLLAYLHLKPNVGGCGGPIKRIGFEANLLGMHRTAAETHQISYDYQFTYYFHIQIQSFTYKFNQLSYNILSAENFLISYRSC